MPDSATSTHGVYYFGRLVTISSREQNGYTNVDLVLLRDGSTETDKIAVKPGSETEKTAREMESGTEVCVRVIPPRRAISKAGSVYVKSAFALSIAPN